MIRKFMISTAGSRHAKDWNPQETVWPDFLNRLSHPVVSTETIQQFKAARKAKQDDLKDVGGYVAGTLAGNRRKAGSLTGRCMITLDADNVPAGTTEDIARRVSGLGCAYAIHSTRKHEPAAPHLRIIIPLDRDCTPDEYEPIARKIAAMIGLTLFDSTTFEGNRFMYWPSRCNDVQYVFYAEEKPFLSCNEMLDAYSDWRDRAEWPRLPTEKEAIDRLMKKQQNPQEKEGVIGAFCRTYDVPAAIGKFIPEVYEDCGNGRYTYRKGSTAAGAVLYEDGLFIYSHHATDPAGGRLLNSFDLVRIHKFGSLDDEQVENTPVNRLHSYTAMLELAQQDQEVHRRYLEETFGGSIGPDLEPFHKMVNGTPRGVFDEAIVRDINAKKEFFIMGSTFFIYSGGVYHEDRNGLTVKGWIKEHIYPQFLTARAVNSVYQLLSFQADKQKQYSDLNCYPNEWINFKNGMFDALNWEMRPHSPEYLSINQVPHEFNGEEPVSTGAVEKFLKEAISDKDDISMLFQYVGYCFTKATLFQKFMILFGIGGTGKSVLISLIIKAVGACNTTSISLQKLNERFYAIELMGKLLNACADIPGDVMRSVDIIKQLVSGDKLMGERKGQDPISFRNVAKLLFSGNSLPLNLDEATNAFYRRLLILKMDNKPVNADPEMEEKLLQDVDYFIYKAVQAVQGAFMLGGIIESQRSRDEVFNLYKHSDSVTAFLDERTAPCTGARVERTALYIAYQLYCGENGRAPLSRSNFYRNMTESKNICHKRDNKGRYFCDIELI